MRFLFHFGMPKAGSTSLQEADLSFKEIAYLLHPDQDFIDAKDREKLFDIWNQHNREGNYAITSFSQGSIKKLQENKQLRTCLISCENAVLLETTEKCCERVLQLGLPSQEALFITRRPSDLVRSLYDMLPYDLDGNWIKAAEFEEIFLTSKDPRYTRLRSWIDYSASIRVLENYFGKDNVHTFRFEDIFRPVASDQFCRFANCLQVPPISLHAKLQECKANQASDHLVSISARRIFKHVHMSRFLPSSFLMRYSLFLSRKLSFLHKKSTYEFKLVKERYDDGSMYTPAD